MAVGKKTDEWLKRLKDKYRLVLMNDDNFEEISSYRLSRLNIYTMLSTVLLLLTIIIFSLIAFTPIRRYIPGYGDVNLRKEVIRQRMAIDSINQVIASNDLYLTTIRDVLTGDIDTSDVDLYQIPQAELDSTEVVNPIAEELLLREEVAQDAIGRLNMPPAVQSLLVSRGNNNGLETRDLIAPIEGFITDPYQPEKEHYGLDVAAAKGTAVKTVSAGVVIVSDWTLDTGYIIGIQHSDNLISFYKHNSVLLKKVGTFVKQGEAIAIIGNTGTLSDGPHLHFELWYQGSPVNPEKYIAF